MSVQEVETIIAHLPPDELAQFAEWFAEFQADEWDKQIARDAQAGRFNALIDRVNAQADAGECRPL